MLAIALTWGVPKYGIPQQKRHKTTEQIRKHRKTEKTETKQPGNGKPRGPNNIKID